MSTLAYIFLPDISFINEAKSKEQIASALNEKYPAGKFDASKIIISRKQNKYNAYAQTTEEHEQKLLELKSIKIGEKSFLLKECFPNHQIYINKLPNSFTKQQISDYFSQFGKIANIELFPAEGGYEILKQKPHINHCYIRFQTDLDAQKCLFSQDRHNIKTKEDIRVVRAYKVGQNDETDRKLFLKITPIVQFDIQKVQKELYTYFKQFGQLRQKIRIEQLSNFSSKAMVTFTSVDVGQKALQNFKFNNYNQYAFILRAFASKESYMAFLGGLKGDVVQENITKALQKYGKIVNCTLNPSKKQGVINAVVTFSDEQSFKLAMSQYKQDPDLIQLFASKPYMDVHMSASIRNDYNNFIKKDKKQTDGNMMNMGGIGVGFGHPQYMNLPTQQYFVGGNQNFAAFNPSMGMANLGNAPKISPPSNNNPNYRQY